MTALACVFAVLLVLAAFKEFGKSAYKQHKKWRKERAHDEAIARVDQRFADQDGQLSANSAVRFFANDLEAEAPPVKEQRRVTKAETPSTSRRVSLEERIEPTLGDMDILESPAGSSVDLSAYEAAAHDERDVGHHPNNPEPYRSDDDIVSQQSFDAPPSQLDEEEVNSLMARFNEEEERNNSSSESDSDETQRATSRRQQKRGGGHKYL